MGHYILHPLAAELKLLSKSTQYSVPFVQDQGLCPSPQALFLHKGLPLRRDGIGTLPGGQEWC